MRGGVTGVVVCNAPEAIGLPGFSVMEPLFNVRRRTILTSLVDSVVSSGNLSTHSSSMEGGCFGLGCVFGHERNRMISHLVGAGARDDVSGWCCGISPELAVTGGIDTTRHTNSCDIFCQAAKPPNPISNCQVVLRL